MRIEEEIKQTKFINEYQKLLVNIMVSYNWLINEAQVIINNTDITLTQYNVLRILRGAKGPLTTHEIKERMLEKNSDTSRLVERLLQKKYVIKTLDTQDRRRVSIAITKKGLRLLTAVDDKELIVLEKMSNISTTEATRLNTLLDALRTPEV